MKVNANFLRTFFTQIKKSLKLRKLHGVIDDVHEYLNLLKNQNDTNDVQRKKKNDEQAKQLLEKLRYMPNLLHRAVTDQNVCLQRFCNYNQTGLLKSENESLISRFLFYNESTGRGFAFYRPIFVEFVDKIKKYLFDKLKFNRFEKVAVPIALNKRGMMNSMHYANMKQQMWQSQFGKKNFFLLPTAESAFCNYDQIKSLPARLTACTPCFRREGGTSGKRDKNFFRLYQFNKIEMFVFCNRKHWQREMFLMKKMCCDFLHEFGLSYEIILNSATNMSKSASLTFDVNVFCFEKKIEISSISYCSDYQISNNSLFEKHVLNRNNSLATLNGSFFGLERLFVCILQNSFVLNKQRWEFNPFFRNQFGHAKIKKFGFDKLLCFLNDRSIL